MCLCVRGRSLGFEAFRFRCRLRKLGLRQELFFSALTKLNGHAAEGTPGREQGPMFFFCLAQPQNGVSMLAKRAEGSLGAEPPLRCRNVPSSSNVQS